MFVVVLSNKIPLWIGSLTALALLTVTGCISREEALSGFSHPTTITLVSMYVVSGGLNRTQMVRKVSNLVYKVTGASFTKGLLGYMLVTLLIAQVIPSALLVYTVCAPLLADFCKRMGVSPSKAMFSLGLVSISSIATMPIGIGATTYITYNTILDKFGADPAFRFGMFDSMIGKGGVAVAMLLYAVFIAPKLAPDKGLEIGIAVSGKKAGEEKKPLSPIREVLGYGIFLVVVICLLLANYLPIASWQICLAGALLVTITGVLKEKETVAALNLPPALLFVGALALAQGLMNTGAGDLIGNMVVKLLGGNPSGYLVGFVFFTISFLFTQVMSNSALFQALRPVCILVCTSLGYNPMGPFLLCYIGSFTSFLTPMATIMVPAMMDAGGYNQKDILKQGWLPGIIAGAVAVPWVMTIFPV
jgi:di/tricarboxylate transporter